MDDLKVGALCRAVRRRHGWRQSDVAQVSGTPQTCVSRLERGQLEHLRLRTIRRITAALEISLQIEPRWRGGEGARLLDEDHAHLVGRCAAVLRKDGWATDLEYTFNVYGERGSVDIVAWHAGTRSLLIVEVKSSIVDLQDLLSTVDRKVRLVPALVAAQHGWRPTVVSKLVFAPATTRNRRIIAEHESVLHVAFPARGRDARRWVGQPAGALSALWLARIATTRADGTAARARMRIRVPSVPAGM
jgi:transcriptional regulator with XRE-family HTH domain